MEQRVAECIRFSAIVAFLSVAIWLAQTTLLNAASCLNDSRELKVDGNQVIRLRELRCRIDRDPTLSLRVQFQRLDEGAAGVLLNNGKAPWFERLYGKTRLIANDVLKEYLSLIQKFGTARRFREGEGESGNGVWFEVQGLDQPERKEATKGGDKVAPRVVQSYVLPHLYDMPLVDELLHILNQPTWPSSVALSYSRDKINNNNPFEDLRIWRYLTRADLDAFGEWLKRYNEILSSGQRPSRASPKAVELFQYLTANGWPENFLHVETPISGDGCLPLNFGVNYYKFEVEIALVGNTSSSRIVLDQLLGAQVGGRQLRVAEEGIRNPGVGSELDIATTLLEPGETVIVPLRLVFKTLSEDLTDNPADLVEYRANRATRFERIQASPQGTIFKLTVFTELRNKQKRGKYPSTYEIRKSRESFKPHSGPVEKSYAFGPEWFLTGLKVGNERIDFARVNADFINLTSAGEAGSCPILYTWSTADHHWERYGKIMHKAQTRANRQSETLAFEGWVPRFRIAEEELEFVRFDEIRAVIRLANGTLRDLAFESREFARTDGHPTDLYAGDEVELRFALPQDVAPRDVIETRLLLTGYYERYSDLLIARASERVRPEPAPARLPRR